MNTKISQTLEVALNNWKAMSQTENEEAESTANEFEASFYRFIDAVREWFNNLEKQPQTLEEFIELPMIAQILKMLPGPLHLNFETEAELILENLNRIDDAKYD